MAQYTFNNTNVWARGGLWLRALLQVYSLVCEATEIYLYNQIKSPLCQEKGTMFSFQLFWML